MTCEVATTFVKTFLATNEFQDFKTVASVFYSDSETLQGLKLVLLRYKDVTKIWKLGHN